MDPLKYLTNCKVYSTVRQEEDEDAWLKARTRGIGGSDIGAICGVSPFTSARQVYLNKTGQFTESMKPCGAAQERMHFGHLLEPIVADEFAARELVEDKANLKLVNIGATLQHKDYPWAIANVDRLIVDTDGRPWGILECKTTSEYMNEEWESGEILQSYVYQLNWYLWILGLERGYFACLVGGNKFYTYPVYRNDELINEVMLPAAKKFWNENVLALKEPEMQSVDTDFVNKTYSDVVKNSELVMEDDTANDLAETVFNCKRQIKELTSIMEEAQNKLKDRLKENEIGYTKDYTIKWSPRSQKRVDNDKLKKEYPEVYQEVLKITSFRVMSVKGAN